jgi:hypothetical protein
MPAPKSRSTLGPKSHLAAGSLAAFALELVDVSGRAPGNELSSATIRPQTSQSKLASETRGDQRVMSVNKRPREKINRVESGVNSHRGSGRSE